MDMTHTDTTGRGSERGGHVVVVGVDGTRTSLRAVTWAAEEAQARLLPLQILHAAPYALESAAGARRARTILGRAFTVARRHRPDVPVHTERSDLAPAQALLTAAADAALLVVGMIGGDYPADALASSVAVAVAGRATCPVVVVRGREDVGDGPVVVGLAGEDERHRDAEQTHPGAGAVPHGHDDTAVLDVAFAEAARNRTALVAVRAHPAHGRRSDAERQRERDHERERLVAELAPWSARFPEVAVDVRVSPQSPTEALLTAAVPARLLVVGGGRHTGAARALFGSTCRDVLRFSPVPVAVVGRGGPRPAQPSAGTAEGGAVTAR